MKNLSWVDLEKDCPIPIDRIVGYSKDFESDISINFEDMSKAKESLFQARCDLDMMITSLIQLLYDRELLKDKEDIILFGWLKDDLGRFMKKLDEKESEMLLDQEFVDPSKDRITVSRLSAYSKILKISSYSLIYETILKSTKEYNSFEETENLKREPRTFLYILFHLLQVTLSVLGGLTREKTGVMSKRGVINNFPMDWRGLMTDKGKHTINESFKQETGLDSSDFYDEIQE